MDCIVRLKHVEEIKDISNSVPDHDYSGYLWFSDSSRAEIINGRLDLDCSETFPFIIEGNLWAEAEEISVSIRFVDGMFLVAIVNLKEAKKEKDHLELVFHEYQSHGFSGNPTLKFMEAWIAEDDPLCEGLPTLMPAWVAFTGFGSKTVHNSNS